MDPIAELTLQVIAGATGGVVLGSALKRLSLGIIGDALSGAIGGGLAGQAISLLTMAISTTDKAAGTSVAGFARHIVFGVLAGAALTALVGAVRNALAKR